MILKDLSVLEELDLIMSGFSIRKRNHRKAVRKGVGGNDILM